MGGRETRAVLRSPARLDGIERCLRLSDRGSHHEQADISTLSDERLDALEAALRQTVLMLEQANVFRLGLRLQHEVWYRRRRPFVCPQNVECGQTEPFSLRRACDVE